MTGFPLVIWINASFNSLQLQGDPTNTKLCVCVIHYIWVKASDFYFFCILDTQKIWESLIQKIVAQNLGKFWKFQEQNLRGVEVSKCEKLNHEYLKLDIFTIQIITNMNRIALSKMLRKNNGWKFIFSNSAMDMHNGSRSIRL